MSFFPSPLLDAFSALVDRLAALLQPLAADASTALAVVLFTVLVRLAVHPLSRAAVRGQQARVRLAPRIAALQEKHKRRPERLQRAILDLHAEEKVSPFAGILPSLLQVPAFLLLYALFSSGDRMGGHGLFAAPLDGRWTGALGDGGPFGPAGLVYLALFAVALAVAAYQYLRTRRETGHTPAQTPSGGPAAAVGRILPLLSFGTVVTVAVVPLAVALYLVTSTTWAVVERALLMRKGPQAERGLAG
ncbi:MULTISPECIES: membrane protein insertase YidC [unclassified Streptomyces]|uniref:YidC/Oxa1 family membrane protein insertase n=1 Tax=unclassified Streptomyces TaxID=2593676 RepID=UPI001F105381|nr:MULTISPECIES: membrane protein insertase YidC [unclassified Streptomyces]